MLCFCSPLLWLKTTTILIYDFVGQESGLSWVDFFLLMVPTGFLGAPQLVSRTGWRVQDTFPHVWSLLGMAGWLHSVATVDWNFYMWPLQQGGLRIVGLHGSPGPSVIVSRDRKWKALVSKSPGLETGTVPLCHLLFVHMVNKAPHAHPHSRAGDRYSRSQ